ncbi:MAG: metal-dependent transcriptional regulator [Phycisphaerae bacterium]|jgi:DtxR family Mn-dependent transcriptional regulator|nr:metal-dependent transcriptional regulator [Phycisphaerae bacterium]MDP7636985.1 metal-dependent transcriptional regulator [Phycisphaerae bacterium]
MATGSALSASLEDYLETIFRLVAEKRVARAKDIASSLKVHKSSVTSALHALAEQKLVNYAPYGLITLTAGGQAAAKDVVRRHEVLRDFFVKVLTVPAQQAGEAACKMEHVISQAILERFVQFVEFVDICPRGGDKWIRGIGYHCQQGKTQKNCQRCISMCLENVRTKRMQQEQTGKTTISLRDLKAGQKAKITKVRGQGKVNKRLLEMGVTAGTVVEVERIAPLGDPIEVKIKGYHLSLRKEQAKDIDVEML